MPGVLAIVPQENPELKTPSRRLLQYKDPPLLMAQAPEPVPVAPAQIIDSVILPKFGRSALHASRFKIGTTRVCWRLLPVFHAAIMQL